jgi:hypothetical protein
VSLLSGERADSLAQFGTFMTFDDDLAAAARVVPGGFGGMMYLNGTPTFYLVDTTQHAAAAAALVSSHLSTNFSWSSANVLPARWDFAQMYDWYHYLGMHATTPGISITDIDEGKNRIMFGVVDTQARAALEARLAVLDVPCYLVAIEIMGPVELRSRRP